MVEQDDDLPEPLLRFDGVQQALRHQLTRVDAALERYRAEKADGRILENSLEALRVEFIYNSNAIEGSSLNLRETSLALDRLRLRDSQKDDEACAAFGHLYSLRVTEFWAELRRAAIKPIDDHVYAVLIKCMRFVFVPVEDRRVTQLGVRMLDLANRPAVHVALRAAELHCNFVAIHRQTRGKRQAAQLLMNYSLMRNGYPLTIIEAERRGEYLAALEDANAGRAEPFARFVLESVERSIIRLIGE